ncbi:MAG: pantetheine-phosphate adenylyltransferase [bacterium]
MSPMTHRREPVRVLYPGTFDPLTRGHEHLILRLCQLFDTVVIAAAQSSDKGTVFTLEERLDLIARTVEREGLDGVKVISFHGLTVDLAREQGCQVIARGLRAISDYEYEVQMAIVNKSIAPSIDTVFLMADKDHSFISSSIIKDILRHGGTVEQVSGMVEPAIARELQSRLLAGVGR